ncbi:MAG TPA: hypothetical protein VLZ74_07605 [Methylocella sp.]|nr:hypothetical protein [Methylocella sp.]
MSLREQAPLGQLDTLAVLNAKETDPMGEIAMDLRNRRQNSPWYLDEVHLKTIVL